MGTVHDIHRSKAGGTWNWSVKKYVDLYIHAPIRPNGVELRWLSTGTLALKEPYEEWPGPRQPVGQVTCQKWSTKLKVPRMRQCCLERGSEEVLDRTEQCWNDNKQGKICTCATSFTTNLIWSCPGFNPFPGLASWAQIGHYKTNGIIKKSFSSIRLFDDSLKRLTLWQEHDWSEKWDFKCHGYEQYSLLEETMCCMEHVIMDLLAAHGVWIDNLIYWTLKTTKDFHLSIEFSSSKIRHKDIRAKRSGYAVSYLTFTRSTLNSLTRNWRHSYVNISTSDVNCWCKHISPRANRCMILNIVCWKWHFQEFGV